MKYLVNRCGYCGACVAVCTNKSLELEEYGIIILPGCKECGDCLKVCPVGAMRRGKNEV